MAISFSELSSKLLVPKLLIYKQKETEERFFVLSLIPKTVNFGSE